MIMSAALSIEPTHSPNRATGRGALSALCEVWTAYTLKRAIADVASTRDEDYRDFGLDKGEILAALTSLRDEIKGKGTLVASPSCRRGCNGCRLVIEVAKHEPALLVYA
jgi:hypothetical protein